MRCGAVHYSRAARWAACAAYILMATFSPYFLRDDEWISQVAA